MKTASFIESFFNLEHRPSKSGFDIVIANPPYINIQLIPEADRMIYKNSFVCFEKRSDLFSVFLEKALTRLTTSNGIVTFIIPSIIQTNLSYKKIRNLFLGKHWLKEVCYTGGDVFKEPTVDTTILLFNKGGNKTITLKNAVDFLHPTTSVVDVDYFSKFDNVISISDDRTNSLMSKLFDTSLPRLEEHYSVFQGIVTGNNPAFIFDSESEATGHGIEPELLHTFCHGRDIEKYAIRSNDRRILYVNNDVDIDNYPGAKDWLSKFKQKLETRREVKRNVIRWYSLQWPRVKSELDNTEKIWLQRTRNESLKLRIVGTLDQDGAYTSEGILNLIPTDSDSDLHYLLGILNSKLVNYLFATKFLNLAIKAEYLKQLRIPIAEGDLHKKLVNLVDEILAAKRIDIHADTFVMETEIDNIVYHLYDLSYEELLTVDSQTPISREAYEGFL